MAEGRGNRKAGASSRKTREQDETMLGNDVMSDDGMDEGYTSNMNGDTMDPMDRVAQLYHFLRSPQVDQTIRRFVASRKTRQLIAAGLSILEVVVILMPLMKKLGVRVSDMTSLLKQPAHPRRSGTARNASGRSTSSRTLPAHTGSVN